MSLFENFPYTDLHQLNLDWLINELKMVKESAVISVNGQTGEVILYEDADIEFPATDNGGWDIIRKVDGTVNAGIRFTGDGVAYLITGSRVRQMYDADHQPPYPVTSVNGETGAVTITPPVTSVNGQTGEVILYREQYVHLPDLTGEQLQNWNFYRNINNILHGIQFDTDGRAYIMNGAGRYQIYTEHNAQPFTFVDNVDAGVMEISQAAPAGVWGLLRETDSGTAGIVFSYDSTEPTAYLRYITGSGEQAVTHNVKLLTPDDIPSSSGVLSINGLAGVVVITGTDINYKTGSTLKIGSMIDSILESVGNLASLTTTDKTSLVNAVNELVTAIGTVNTDISNLGTRISNAESTVGIVQTGATATQNISAGQYVIWNDALYKASTNISAGDTFSGTNLQTVLYGIANELIPESFQLTLPTGRTGIVNRCYKIGNIVIINFHITHAETISAEVSLATIPASYAPSYDIVSTGILSGSYTDPCLIKITNGTLYYDTGSSPHTGCQGEIIYALV